MLVPGQTFIFSLTFNKIKRCRSTKIISKAKVRQSILPELKGERIFPSPMISSTNRSSAVFLSTCRFSLTAVCVFLALPYDDPDLSDFGDDLDPTDLGEDWFDTAVKVLSDMNETSALADKGREIFLSMAPWCSVNDVDSINVRGLDTRGNEMSPFDF